MYKSSLYIATCFVLLALCGCGKTKAEKDAEMEVAVANARSKLDAAEEKENAAKARQLAAEQAASDAVGRSALIAMVRENMIDPNSAVFDRVIFKRGWLKDKNGATTDALCGVVNGKNRMGGYTGAQTFFAYRDNAGKPVVWFSGDELVGVIARESARSMGC